MVLSDYGAEVIKVERPGTGDGTRQWGPPWVGSESAYFLSVNRNKKSVVLNLKEPAGQRVAGQLAAECDVLIENFKPGTAERMGLGYTSLAAGNPGLIYCSISGYGQTGPYRDRPGYDSMIQAQGGIMSITGPRAGDPQKVGVAIVDVSAGLFAATAILAALHARKENGEGQHIDVALLDSQVGWLANVAQNYLATGEPPRRYGNAHPNIVPYETFATQDGHLALAVGTDEQFERFCRAVDRADLWARRVLPHQRRPGNPQGASGAGAARPLRDPDDRSMAGAAAGGGDPGQRYQRYPFGARRSSVCGLARWCSPSSTGRWVRSRSSALWRSSREPPPRCAPPHPPWGPTPRRC